MSPSQVHIMTPKKGLRRMNGSEPNTMTLIRISRMAVVYPWRLEALGGCVTER